MTERFPKKKMSKSERQAERNRKRELGGLPLGEAPLEGPMQAAFKKNGIKNGEDGHDAKSEGLAVETSVEFMGPPAPEIPSEVVQHEAEVQEEITGRIPDRPASTEKDSDTFDPLRYEYEIEGGYLRMASSLRKLRIDPEKIPPQAWQELNTAIGRIKQYAQEYQKETNLKRRKRIRDKMEDLGERMNSMWRSLHRAGLESQSNQDLKGQGDKKGRSGVKARKKPHSRSKTKGQEGPFDPHSVQSAVEVKEQKMHAEMRNILAEEGMISHESVPDRGVDISGVHVPQYTEPPASAQRDMDELAVGAETEQYQTQKQKKYPSGSSPLVGALEHAEEFKRLRDEYADRKQALEQVLDSKYPKGVPTSIVGQLDHLDALFKASVREDREEDVLPQVLANLQSLAESESPSQESQWDWKAAKEAATAETVQAEEQTTAEGGVPVLITQEMHTRLEDLGYTSKRRSQMTPQEAWDILKSGKPPHERKKEEERELVPEDAPDYIKDVVGDMNEKMTPGEAKSTLSRLLEGYKKTLAGAKEKVDWWKSSSEQLIRRSKELDAQAEKVGGLENAFRKLGEQYNKLGWKSKLAVGLGLGLGAGISMAAVSLPGIIAFTAGIGAQRAAGLATMYLKYEKAAIEKGKDKESRFWKEKQFAKAALYTAGMTAGMAYAVKEISETEFAQRAAQWLKEQYPFGSSPDATLSGEATSVKPPVEGPPLSVAVPSTPEASIAEPAASVAGEGTVVPEPALESLSVGATKGYGYEYMAKRLWEDLQTKGLDPNNFDDKSDIHALLKATPETINKVVHELAIKNEFFKPDGASVRIDMDSTLSFNNEGALALNGSVSATENALMTPPYPQTPLASAAAPEAPQMPDYKTEAAAIGVEIPAAAPVAETIRDSVPTHEIHGAPAEHLVSQPMADIPAPPEPPAPLQSPESIAYIPAPDEVPVPQPSEAVSEIPAESSIAIAEPPVAVEQVADSITNQYGLEVSISKPHIYADANAERLFVYGGSPEVRAETIAKYLTENPKNVIFAADDSGTYRIPWHLVDGKPEPGAPMRTNGLFGFFSTWMSPPEPGEFAKVVK